MKKAELLLAAAVLIFLCCNFNYAQVEEENYDKTVDFFNCKVVEKSLDEYAKSANQASRPIAKQTYEDFQKESQNCRNTDYKGIQLFLELRGNYSDTKKLSTEINGLKQKYSEEKSVDQLITLLSDESFKDLATYPLLVRFANKPRNGNDFADFKEQLKTPLKEYISPQQQGETPRDGKKIDETPPKIFEDPPTPFSSRLAVVLSILAFIISAALLLVLFTKLRSSENSGGSHKVAVRTTTQKTLETHTTDIATINLKIQSLINRVTQLENEQNNREIPTITTSQKTDKNKDIEDIKQQGKGIFEETDTSDSAGQPSNSQYQQTGTQSSRDVFYFPTPSQDGGFNDNGSFNDADRHPTFTPGKTIYKFSKLSGNKAEFEIDSREDSVRLALNYSDRAVDPVCEVENSSGNKSRIINVRAGEAILDGPKWKVTKKAIIRYE